MRRNLKKFDRISGHLGESRLNVKNLRKHEETVAKNRKGEKMIKKDQKESKEFLDNFRESGKI